MSLRTALTAFGSVLKQRKSSTPLRKALDEFARALDPKTAKQKFSAQQSTLTKLAQRMLISASAAGKEDRQIIGGVCTLVAAALTQQVRAEARASDDDWRWLARCADVMLDCDAGGYDEAEALVRHLLESSWAELLSPVAVSALLERLKGIGVRPFCVWDKALVFHLHHPPDPTKKHKANQSYAERGDVAVRAVCGYAEVRPEVVFSTTAEREHVEGC